MTTRRFAKQYGYIAVSLVLAFVCAATPLVAHNLNQQARGDAQNATAWTGWSTVSDAGHFQSGNMTQANSRHDWYVRNTLTGKNDREKKKRSIRCNWEASATVTKKFADRNPWESNTLTGSVDLPAQSAKRYHNRHLKHGCDFFSDPGVYTYQCYTAVRIVRLDLDKNDGDATTPTLSHVITIDE